MDGKKLFCSKIFSIENCFARKYLITTMLTKQFSIGRKYIFCYNIENFIIDKKYFTPIFNNFLWIEKVLSLSEYNAKHFL